MYVTPGQIIANHKASVEALLALANSNFAAIDKLAALNFNATKLAFEDSISHAKALLYAKDVQEFVNLNVAAAQPSLEKFIAYSRSVYELSTQQHGEFIRLYGAQAGEFNRSLGRLDKDAKNAPAGSDLEIAAVKSALAAAHGSAYDGGAKVTKQATETKRLGTTAGKRSSRRRSVRSSRSMPISKKRSSIPPRARR